MESKRIMNAQETSRIWFRCMEKRADCEGCLAVSDWHGAPEEAWRAAAANDPEMKPVVEEHLARGELKHDKAIRINERIWQLTWNSRDAMISNGQEDLPPVKSGMSPPKRNS